MGMATIEKVLPKLKVSEEIDVVIAQVENLSDGKGMLPADLETMRAAGVDAFTGGNWSWAKAEAFPLLEDPSWPIVRPANYADITLPGRGSTPFTSLIQFLPTPQPMRWRQ
jgi:calcineurin-like phosphoesterase